MRSGASLSTQATGDRPEHYPEALRAGRLPETTESCHVTPVLGLHPLGPRLSRRQNTN